MENIYLGGCQCGEIRYEIHGEPLTFYACHCRECQKQSASAFGLSLTIARDALKIVSGQPKIWTRESDSGREVNCAFCGNCGTRIYHDRAHDRSTLNIKAGTLDDPNWLHPVGNIWTQSAQPWVSIANDLLNYPAQPETTDRLWEKWSESVTVDDVARSLGSRASVEPADG